MNLDKVMDDRTSDEHLAESIVQELYDCAEVITIESTQTEEEMFADWEAYYQDEYRTYLEFRIHRVAYEKNRNLIVRRRNERMYPR